MAKQKHNKHNKKEQFEIRAVRACVYAGVLTLIVMSAYMLLRPDIKYVRAKNGDAEQVIETIGWLQKNEYDESRIDDLRERAACLLLDEGDREYAMSMAEDISDGRDIAYIYSRAEYMKAEEKLDAGAYTEAAGLFYALNDYEDSQSRYLDCVCASAIKSYLNGETTAAQNAIASISDAPERVGRMASSVAGNRADEVVNCEIFTYEGMEKHALLAASLKQSLSEAKCVHAASGRYHNVILRYDGSVLCAGDNSKGQCETSLWTNISCVAAGRYHTVGLRADGTVVACGDNSYGQTEVSGWTDITALCCGAFDTIGLKSDGTIVACGMNASKVDGKGGIKSICAGGYRVVALTTDGQLLSTHTGSVLEGAGELKCLCVCGNVLAGLTQTGSTLTSEDNLPKWEGMAYVCLSENGFFGITEAGEVKAQYFRTGTDFGIALSEAAAEIAVSATGIVIITENGNVFAFGDNSCGQLDINGMSL